MSYVAALLARGQRLSMSSCSVSPAVSLPDSPLSGSGSSLPSVSSSFFFSSAAASPPHSAHLDATLIIPSLTLPTALPRSTPYGQTLGDLRVLVLLRKGADPGLVSSLLLDDNEDVVDVGPWEDGPHARTIKASTDWLEHSDAHGLERFEPLRNVEFTEFPAYESDTDVDELVQNVISYVHRPFQSVSDVLHPDSRPSAVLSSLLCSPCSPLHTALLLLLPHGRSLDNLDHRIMDQLGSHIPIITLSSDSHLPALSSFQPRFLPTLRAGLFRSPETLALLRSEAADRFLRWREIECAVADICSVRYSPNDTLASSSWDKEKWESEWMPSFSADVAKRLNTPKTCSFAESFPPPAFGRSSIYDPLHLPSLLVFSISLLGPLKERLEDSLSFFWDALDHIEVKAALIGGFLVGIGVGLIIR